MLKNTDSTVGEPKGVFQNILAKMYPIILIILTIIVTYLIKPLKSKINLRFVIYILVGAFFGWSWNWFTVIFDPSMPGWAYHPWAIIGIKYGKMVLEDFIFYILCGALFYLVRYYTPNIGTSKESSKYIVLSCQIALTLFASYIFNVGGQSISLWFTIPGILMLWLTRDSWNLPRFFIVGMFVVLMGSNWDTIATTIIPSIPGYAWASEWFYISFDTQGIAHHSTLWLSYADHRWAWVGNVPIEIMYWFNISGWWFIYGLAQVCENWRKKSE